jgi:hypothetical protein
VESSEDDVDEEEKKGLATRENIYPLPQRGRGVLDALLLS